MPEEREKDQCECADEPVPGAGWPFNDQAEVQRCDLCEKFDSDYDAALAVVDALNELANEQEDDSSGDKILPAAEDGEGPFTALSP